MLSLRKTQAESSSSNSTKSTLYVTEVFSNHQNLLCFCLSTNITTGHRRPGLLDKFKELFELPSKVNQQGFDLVACFDAVPVPDTLKSLQRDMMTTCSPAAVFVS